MNGQILENVPNLVEEEPKNEPEHAIVQSHNTEEKIAKDLLLTK